MVWLHPKKIKKKNEETLGSNFRGYTHTHCMVIYTQKKEGFCDSRGVQVKKIFPSEYTSHTSGVSRKNVVKKNYL